MKSKIQKQEQLKKINQIMKNSNLIIFFDYQPLKSNDLTSLRLNICDDNSKLNVFTNNLISIYKKNDPTMIFELSKGPNMVFHSSENLDVAKNKFQYIFKIFPDVKINGGKIENNYYYGESMDEYLKLPEKNILISKLLITLLFPIIKLQAILKQKK